VKIGIRHLSKGTAPAILSPHFISPSLQHLLCKPVPMCDFGKYIYWSFSRRDELNHLDFGMLPLTSLAITSRPPIPLTRAKLHSSLISLSITGVLKAGKTCLMAKTPK